MRNARRDIKCFIANNQIEVQYLKRFNRFRWRCSLNQTMHLWNRTRIALNDFRSVFLNYFNLINLFNWLIFFDRQCLDRKCQFQRIVFAKIFLWDWTALTNFFTNRYFKRDKSCFFSMSQIITSIDLITSRNDPVPNRDSVRFLWIWNRQESTQRQYKKWLLIYFKMWS
jgi:hypothetical protein